MPRFHSLAQAGEYPALPLADSHRLGNTSERPLNKRRNIRILSEVLNREGVAVDLAGAEPASTLYVCSQLMPWLLNRDFNRAFSSRSLRISSCSDKGDISGRILLNSITAYIALRGSPYFRGSCKNRFSTAVLILWPIQTLQEPLVVWSPEPVQNK